MMCIFCQMTRKLKSDQAQHCWMQEIKPRSISGRVVARKAACLMCKVKVDDQMGLAPMNTNERLKLGSQADEGIRLACQARVTGLCR